VVSEGVEHIEQEQILIGHCCQEVQGFYYARPMPSAELLLRYKTTQVLLEKI
jgi:EAL domain-containing protein (putative c-di-GMP-specific phosphodiesterase class I)